MAGNRRIRLLDLLWVLVFKAVSDMCVYVHPSIPPTNISSNQCFWCSEGGKYRKQDIGFIKFELSKSRKQKTTRGNTGRKWGYTCLADLGAFNFYWVFSIYSRKFQQLSVRVSVIATGLGTSYYNILPATTCLFVEVGLVILAGSNWNAKWDNMHNPTCWQAVSKGLPGGKRIPVWSLAQLQCVFFCEW